MVRRLVGFHEYGHALDHLDRLVSMCEEEDIVAIDKILDDHHEFDLFVKLPDGFRPGTSDGSEELRDHRRRGLAWVIALARVEFGAMVAGFTTHPNPYQLVQPSSLEYAETLQLLLEGVEGHFRALNDAGTTDAQTKKLYGDNQIKSTLAKARRVRIARVMLQALEKVDLANYSERQTIELTAVQRELNRQQKDLRDMITIWLAERKSRQKTVSSSSFENKFVNACGIQLAAERRELEAGTATVTNFPADQR